LLPLCKVGTVIQLIVLQLDWWFCIDLWLACRNGAAPLLEVELELLTPDMVWKPELAGSQKGSLQALVQRWLMSFLEVRQLLLLVVICGSHSSSVLLH
jgi:hypothetical protein